MIAEYFRTSVQGSKKPKRRTWAVTWKEACRTVATFKEINGVDLVIGSERNITLVRSIQKVLGTKQRTTFMTRMKLCAPNLWQASVRRSNDDQ